jgi:hypothetical protein
VPDGEGELIGGLPDVQRDDDRAAAECGQDQLAPLDAVVGQDGDPVAGADASSLQAGGQRAQ